MTLLATLIPEWAQLLLGVGLPTLVPSMIFIGLDLMGWLDGEEANNGDL